ncbi:hypothetical protein HOP50_15g74260 [Chloropicon primus]|uniref:Uncharacterized protein n=1 Tax=Chloropicon primus TaxID=1764295 RepID=A0A5B8MWD4_9CHLO|nr:hypothetical protein A3770_15p74010 [Chloropicon primus]UPR04093.1 hypothetical protein HOP50_15g74260 [Chloropicon primus]|eukprot:QDZ24883.1 hypothetical protein A3770_15p74010 [Chloropicon primus]
MAFVKRLRSLVSLSRRGKRGSGEEESQKDEGDNHRESDAENSVDLSRSDGEGHSSHGSEADSGDEESDGYDDFSHDWGGEGGQSKAEARRGRSVLEHFDGAGLSASLRFAMRRVFEKRVTRDSIFIEDAQVIEASQLGSEADSSEGTKKGKAGKPGKEAAPVKGRRLFSRNPYFHLSCLVGSCLDKSLLLLIKRDFTAAVEHLEEVGALPETVSPNSPLCRSAEFRPSVEKRREMVLPNGSFGAQGGAHQRVSSAAKYGPACWGLPHTVFAVDRQRLKVLRGTVESTEGCQRAFQFSLTLSEFSSDDLDTLDGRKSVTETFLLSTMVSVQRTSLGSFSTGFNHNKKVSDKYLSLMSDIPAVIGLQEDVLVSGSYLTGALATFVQHLMLQVQDLMDTKLHVIEGLYISEKPMHPATFRVNQFDENQNSHSHSSKGGSKTNRGIKFALSEMFDTLEYKVGDKSQTTRRTSLSFVKAVKRAVLQQKIITLSVVLHVDVVNKDDEGQVERTKAKFPKRLMRVLKRYVFHHEAVSEGQLIAESIAHFSGDPFEAIYSGVFLSQKAVRRYLQLYSENSPMEAIVFEPNLAKRKDMMSEFMSLSEVRPALCEMLSYALLEWSQDVYNTQSSVSPNQVHQIMSAIVNGHSLEEDAVEEFDEYHMSLLSAVVELVLFDCSLSSQLSVISNSAEVVLDILSAELQDSAGDEVSFLKETPPEGEETKNAADARETEIKKEVVDTMKKSVEKGKGFDYLMDHVKDIVNCLGQLDHLGILELVSSSDDSKIVRKSLSKTLDIVKENPRHAFLLMNQLYRASHLIKACSNVLSSGYFHELESTKRLLLDVRAKHLLARKKAPQHTRRKQGKHEKLKDETGASETNGPPPMAYPLALSPMEKAQPGIIEDLRLAASSGLEVVLGGLVWHLSQPPVPLDPYPKSIKLLKGAASAFEMAGSASREFSARDISQAANQLAMLGNDIDRAETMNSLFPVYLTAGSFGGSSSDLAYGSYTALQYCRLESVRAFTSLLMEQVLIHMDENEGDLDGGPISNLWHFLHPISFRKGACNVDIVQSIDGSMSVGNLLSPTQSAGEGGAAREGFGMGLPTVCEYYLIRGTSSESMKDASVVFAEDVIRHIRAYVSVGQSHVLENTEVKRKGGLILDIQVNHPDFLYEDKQKLLSGILNSNFLKSVRVQSHEDPFHKLLVKASYDNVSANQTAQIVSILVAQEHPTLGYVPVVKNIYLSYSNSMAVRCESLPVEAHSQVFIDEASALAWHNWFDLTSYTATCSDFIANLRQSKALGVEKDLRNAEQFTSSLYNLKFFTKAFDSLTQLYIDTLRACISCQELEGILFLGKVLGSDCYAGVSKIIANAILLQAFLDGKSIHLEQLLTTDMHGEMLRRIKIVLDELIRDMDDVLEQDWALPISRPIEVFLHKSSEIRDTIMRGSFDFAVSHVKSVLLWGIESSNYISSAIDISAKERVESILDGLSAAT